MEQPLGGEWTFKMGKIAYQMFKEFCYKFYAACITRKSQNTIYINP